MFPLALPVLLAESDLTFQAAVEQSSTTSPANMADNTLMAGAELGLDGERRGATSTTAFEIAVLYARLLPIAIAATGDPPPPDTFSAEIGTGASWELSPHARFGLDGTGFIATRLGVRAANPLAARDPFAGDRTEYTLGGGWGLGLTAGPHTTVNLTGGYRQAGAVAAEREEAVGVDLHALYAGVAETSELGPSDAITPELRYEHTRYAHALLDVDLTRGRAEVHALSAIVTFAHDFSRKVHGELGGGVTGATPPPLLDSSAAVLAPGAYGSLAIGGPRLEATLDYEYAYTSLGPRIGYGQAHALAIEIEARPVHGGSARDVVLAGVARLEHGSAPVAADPPLATVDEPAPPAEGTVTTSTIVLGAELRWPIARGLALFGGIDLEYARAALDPSPAEAPDSSFRTIATFGLAGVLSTNPRRTVRERAEPEDGPAPRPPDEDAPADGGLAIRGPARGPALADTEATAPPVEPTAPSGSR